MTGRCEIGPEGRVTGPISIEYNSPWPCPNGTPDGFVSPAYGVVLHTEDGSEAGTRSWFNDSAAEVSAFFSVGFDGSVMQYGPLTGDWMAWSQADGNERWIGIEHEDDEDPSKPFSDAQLTATAHLAEVLSRHYGFPLEEATDPFTRHGITLHSEGGEAFGGHLECPGPVRAAQRPEIIARAKAIRAGSTPMPTPPKPEPAKPTPVLYVTSGPQNLAELAAAHKTLATTILRVTTGQYEGSYPDNIAQWLNALFAGAVSPSAAIPAGLHLYLPPV